jgi:hypothetical protein
MFRNFEIGCFLECAFRDLIGSLLSIVLHVVRALEFLKTGDVSVS